jgi:hypothetical protein
LTFAEKLCSTRASVSFSSTENQLKSIFNAVFQDEIKLIGITVKSLFSLIAVRARGAIKFNKTFFSPFFAV